MGSVQCGAAGQHRHPLVCGRHVNGRCPVPVHPRQHSDETGLLKVILTLLLGYAALCVVAYLFQDRLIFFPRPLWQEPRGEHVEPVALTRPDVTLRGWVVNPESSGPLLIYFGGNAEELSWQVGVFSRLDATTVLVNYRGFGASDGSPSVAHLVEDARAVVAEAQARWGADRHLILFGRSIGSGVAAQATAAAPVDALILMSPFVSLARVGQRHLWFLPVGLLLRDDLDVTGALATLPARILVVHGTADDIVSDAETLALVEKLTSRPEVVAYPGGHNEPLTHPRIWPALRDFIEHP
jgi:uncharacterized protein